MTNDPTAVIFRAMKAAGLDPRNREHVVRFAELMQEEIARLPERALARFQSGDASEVATSAADRVANEQQASRMQKFGKQNDPTEIFRLTDISRTAGQRRNQIRQSQAQPGSPETPDDLWRRAKAAETSGNINASPPAYNVQQPPAEGWNPPIEQPAPEPKPKNDTKGATRIDLNDLWRQAREKGQI